MSCTVSIVVPCFNEAMRLRTDAFSQFQAGRSDVGFLFVDDGSTDGTLKLLRSLEECDPKAFRVVVQPHNLGKAAAVHRGVRESVRSGAAYVGYWDADLATPLKEIPRFVDHLERHPECRLVMGARVALLGRSIERRRARHYPGRVFATMASFVLGLPVYDTQCGAKLLRVTPEVVAAFDEPFETSWSFDVELLARLIGSLRSAHPVAIGDAIYELPLVEWRHVPGSKVRLGDFFVGLMELARIWRRHGRPARGAS